MCTYIHTIYILEKRCTIKGLINKPIKELQVKCKSEKKCPSQIQNRIIDLKMELLVKIVNNFKLKTIFAKSLILDVPQVLSSPLTTINQTFLMKTKELYH